MCLEHTQNNQAPPYCWVGGRYLQRIEYKIDEQNTLFVFRNKEVEYNNPSSGCHQVDPVGTNEN